MADTWTAVLPGRALGNIVCLALPVAFSMLITASNSVMALGWVGQFLKSEVIMSGVSLGILTFNITGLSILFGVSSGLNTLLSQAEGRGDETIVMRRLYVNRMVVIMFVTAVPLGLLNWFSGYILTAAGQPVDVVGYATNFAHLLFAGNLLPCMCFYLQQQVLNTRRQALVPLAATIVGTGAQIVLSMYFLRGFGPTPLNATALPLGNETSYLGAAVSRSAGSVVMVIITGAYMILSRDQICPSGCFCCSPRGRGGRWRRRRDDGGDDGSDGDDEAAVVEQLPELNFWSWNGGFKLLLALCGPSMLLMISEWWGFEALAIMAGNLPSADVSLDANGVLYNINLLMYQLYRGFGVGTSVYVGNSIGRKCDLRLAGGGMRDVAASFSSAAKGNDDVTIDGDEDGDGNGDDVGGGLADDHDSHLDNALVQAAARDAKTFCWTGLVASIGVQLVISVGYYFLRRPLASVFTADEYVIEMAMNATPAAAAAAVGYAMVMPANMVLQGIGLQMVGAVITTCGYFAIGLPLGALLAFTGKMGLSGIWWGNAAALLSSGIATLLFILLRVDWPKEVLKANARLRQASRLREEANRRRQALARRAAGESASSVLSSDSAGLGQPFLDGE